MPSVHGHDQPFSSYRCRAWPHTLMPPPQTGRWPEACPGGRVHQQGACPCPVLSNGCMGEGRVAVFMFSHVWRQHASRQAPSCWRHPQLLWAMPHKLAGLVVCCLSLRRPFRHMCMRCVRWAARTYLSRMQSNAFHNACIAMRARLDNMTKRSSKAGHCAHCNTRPTQVLQGAQPRQDAQRQAQGMAPVGVLDPCANMRCCMAAMPRGWRP